MDRIKKGTGCKNSYKNFRMLLSYHRRFESKTIQLSKRNILDHQDSARDHIERSFRQSPAIKDYQMLNKIKFAANFPNFLVPFAISKCFVNLFFLEMRKVSLESD